MTPSDLASKCREAVASGRGNVVLVLPRTPTGYGIRLTARFGPVGQVLCVNSRGRTVARFDAAAVLRYLEKP